MHHVDVAAPAAGDEGLGAVEHVVVAVAHRAGGERRRVRSRARLGQAIAGEMLHRASASAGSAAAAPSSPKRSIIQAAMLWIEMKGRRRWTGRPPAPRRSSPRPAASAPTPPRRRAHRCRQSPAPPPSRSASTGKDLLLVPLGRIRRHLGRSELAGRLPKRALLRAEAEGHGADACRRVRGRSLRLAKVVSNGAIATPLHESRRYRRAIHTVPSRQDCPSKPARTRSSVILSLLYGLVMRGVSCNSDGKFAPSP